MDAEEEISPNFDSVPQDSMIALKLKEMDLLIKKQECEVEMIRFRILEKQAFRDIEIRKLDLESKRLPRRPIPVPRIQPSSVSSPVSTTDGTVTEDFSHAVLSDLFVGILDLYLHLGRLKSILSLLRLRELPVN